MPKLPKRLLAYTGIITFKTDGEMVFTPFEWLYNNKKTSSWDPMVGHCPPILPTVLSPNDSLISPVINV